MPPTGGSGVAGVEAIRAFEMCGWVVVKRSSRLVILVWPGEENDYPLVISLVSDLDPELLERLLRLSRIERGDFFDCVESIRRERQ